MTRGASPGPVFTLWDLDERAWWTFRMPAAVVHVPAADEGEARAKLRATCYQDAPVDAWPLIGSRFTSREALALSLLRAAL